MLSRRARSVSSLPASRTSLCMCMRRVLADAQGALNVLSMLTRCELSRLSLRHQQERQLTR